MAQWVKMFAVKSDDLSSILKTHRTELIPESCSLTFITHAMAYAYAITPINK